MDDEQNRDDLPPLVKEIRQQTEELIRMFDQVFLRVCGVRWEADMEHALDHGLGGILKRHLSGHRH